jgi:hypothetical protein
VKRLHGQYCATARHPDSNAKLLKVTTSYPWSGEIILKYTTTSFRRSLADHLNHPSMYIQTLNRDMLNVSPSTTAYLHTCIRDIPHSNLASVLGNLIEVFHSFSSFFIRKLREYLQIGHDSFVSNVQIFTSHD